MQDALGAKGNVRARLTGLSTVDDEHVLVRQEEHVAHASLHGHGLHSPGGSSVGDPHASTSLLTREEILAPLGNRESGRSSTSTDENLYRLELIHEAEREHNRRPTRGVVARSTWENRVCLHHLVGDVIQLDRFRVGKDVQSAIRQEVHIRIPVVGLAIVGCLRFFQKIQRDDLGAFCGDKFVAGHCSSAYDYDALVEQDLRGRVPSIDLCPRGRFNPIAGARCRTWREFSARLSNPTPGLALSFRK